MQSPLIERMPLLCRRVWARGGAGVVSVGGVHGFALEVHRHHARAHTLHANTSESLFSARISETTDERCLWEFWAGVSLDGLASCACLGCVPPCLNLFRTVRVAFTSKKMKLGKDEQLIGGRETKIT
jgi:hypothetical protein